MPRAMIRDEVLADSDTTAYVEGNHYFPPESVRPDVLLDSVVLIGAGHEAEILQVLRT